MIRRSLAALVLGAIAVTGLTACQSKVGLAAKVNSVRLSDSALSDYLRTGAAPYTDQSNGSKVVPKLFALQSWVDHELFRNAIRAKGGTASSAEDRAARAAVLGTNTSAQIDKVYAKQGYTPKLADLIIDSNVALVVLVQRLAHGASADQAIQLLQGGQANAQLLAAIRSAKSKVVVSRRYGSWDDAKVALTSDPGAGLPDFVRYPGSSTSLEPTPAP